MRNRELNKLTGVAGRILLSFLFLFSQSAWAGQDQKTKDKADSAQKASAQQAQEKQAPPTPAKVQSEEAQSTAQARNAEEETTAVEEKPSGDGSHEGIKVHGHWTIEVHNPDGTLVTHREFENSLVQGGARGGGGYLSNLMSCGALMNCKLQVWAVILDGTPPPCSIAGAPQSCVLTQSSDNQSHFPAPFVTTSLQGATFVLTGMVTAGENGYINTVNTTATDLLGKGAFFFTGTTLATPIAVSMGQVIQVSVVISFS